MARLLVQEDYMKSSDYALCEHVSERAWRVIQTGSAKCMRSALRASKRENAEKQYCIFFSPGSLIGRILHGPLPLRPC